MAKVSILTFHFSNNLGAMLQAYGLVKALEKEGHEVEVIDYRPLSIRTACEGRLPRHPVRLFRTILFRRRLRSFRRRFLPLSRTYLKPEDLKQEPPEADFVVCGSDQVWNIKSPIRGFDPTFFLDFLPDIGPKRISYATTFGNGFDLADRREQISRLLSRFDRISVRDIKSKEMVHDLIDRSAVHVLDPSFLTDYGPITPPPVVKPPYILTYCFRKTALSICAVRNLREKLKLPVISIKTRFDESKMVYPAPLQWLSLMRHASFVCTDSFHGTCFSLINHKPFLTFSFEVGNSRLKDLLQTANLTDRFIDSDDKLNEALRVPVNYEVASERIEEARERSFTFLCDALR